MTFAAVAHAATLNQGRQIEISSDSTLAFTAPVDAGGAWSPHVAAQKWLKDAFTDEEAPLSVFTASAIGKFTRTDPSAAFRREQREKAEATRANHAAYRARIEALRSEAASEDFHLNPSSEKGFLKFIYSLPFPKKSFVVLMDNGNLRAVWKDGSGNQLGVQFLDEENAQYVIFRSDEGGRIDRVAGCATHRRLRRQIVAFELRELIFQ